MRMPTPASECSGGRTCRLYRLCPCFCGTRGTTIKPEKRTEGLDGSPSRTLDRHPRDQPTQHRTTTSPSPPKNAEPLIVSDCDEQREHAVMAQAPGKQVVDEAPGSVKYRYRTRPVLEPKAETNTQKRQRHKFNWAQEELSCDEVAEMKRQRFVSVGRSFFCS